MLGEFFGAHWGRVERAVGERNEHSEHRGEKQKEKNTENNERDPVVPSIALDFPRSFSGLGGLRELHFRLPGRADRVLPAGRAATPRPPFFTHARSPSVPCHDSFRIQSLEIEFQEETASNL